MKWDESAYFIGSLQELNSLPLHTVGTKEMLVFIISIEPKNSYKVYVALAL